MHAFMERVFPEKRLFIRSDDDTRFVRLRPGTQAIAWFGSAAVVGWTIVATSVLLMDSIGSASLRDQALREQALYEARLAEISADRDARVIEAAAAHERFEAALTQVSQMQSQLLASEDRRRELEIGIDVVQGTLRTTMDERDAARTEVAAMLAEATRDLGDLRTDAAHMADMQTTIAFLTDALGDIAYDRADTEAMAAEAVDYAGALELDIELMEERNDRIFSQLEEAVATSLEPLGDMFQTVSIPTDRIVEEMRRNYSGQGGPLSPVSFSTKGTEPDADELRMNSLLERLDNLNLHRILAAQTPLAEPVRSATRFTSGFGMRRDPVTGARKMHSGSDFAGAYGTHIHATAEGTVKKAGWSSGYGRLVTIEHANGFETRYAHQARIHVKIGQKVSLGEHIGDMGNSGRSTGTHLHYEVRRNGNPVNPMTFIKAARDVF